MKTLSAVVTTLIGFTFATPVFADCYSCSPAQSACTQCRSSYNDACNSCACTEPSCGKNPCLSRRVCCEVYGNVGAYREE